MTLLAITADLHVDDYAGIPGRFDDILRTVAWVARHAKAAGADALIVAGDFTEAKTPARAPRVVKIAAALAEGPARQVHVRGNHDVAWQGSSIVDDLARTPGWTGFSARPGFEVVDGVAVCCIPYLDRAWLRTQPGYETVAEAAVYRTLGELYLTTARGLYVQAKGAGCSAAILVGHQQLSGGRMTEKQQAFLGDLDTVVDARALAAIGYQAIVFGHVHRAQTVIEGLDIAGPVLFSGSIERVDFAEEAEEKSFVLLDVQRGRPASIERIPTPARRYVTLTGEQIADDVTEEQVDGAVVRVIDLPRPYDPLQVADMLRNLGAFAVTEVRRERDEAAAPATGMDETLSAEEALATHFAEDQDRDALLELGREILAEAAA